MVAIKDTAHLYNHLLSNISRNLVAAIRDLISDVSCKGTLEFSKENLNFRGYLSKEKIPTFGYISLCFGIGGT